MYDRYRNFFRGPVSTAMIIQNDKKGKVLKNQKGFHIALRFCLYKNARSLEKRTALKVAVYFFS